MGIRCCCWFSLRLSNIYMKVIDVEISDLKFAEYNPRAATEKEMDDLKESLKRFGFVDPNIVNGAKDRLNVIIGGHMRTKAWQELGNKTAPCVYVDIPDIKKEQELNIRLNKNTGHWDFDMLANFDEKMLIESGFESEELDQIFGLETDEDFDLDKEVKKAIKNPKGVKKGDIWQLGDHKLIVGDSVDKKVWERLLGEEKFDFMFTDPPYKIGYAKGVRRQKTKTGFKLQKARTYPTIGETDKEGKPVKTKGFGYKGNRTYLGVETKGGVPEFDEWLSIADKYQNPLGANVMIFESWKNAVGLWQAIEKYWKIRNMIIWHLPNRHQGFSAKYKFFSRYDIAQLAGNGETNEEYEKEMEDYLKEKGQKILDSYEVILYGSQGKSYWDKGKKKGKWAKLTDHISSTAMTEAKSGQNIIFGTKPTQILVPYLKVLSPRNGLVMEPFGGSGSTIIASEIMKRKCRAIEIEPLYAEVIIARWERFTNKKANKV